jgi:hypothetical protein
MIQYICSCHHPARVVEQLSRDARREEDGAWSSDCGMVIMRAMRHLAACLGFLFGLCVLSGLPVYAQNKTACELLSKADAEAILGVPLLPPEPSEPFRSLLDPDFSSGTPEQGCRFTNFNSKQPKPPKGVNVRLEVRYSSTPNAHAVDETRKQVDTRTYDHPMDLPGLGDAAFWIGPPNNVTVFVFLGGTTRSASSKRRRWPRRRSRRWARPPSLTEPSRTDCTSRCRANWVPIQAGSNN